ncbi:hypothetical protein EON67_07415 [archaeon]|nr:MAG: hypothetical protein EON67_07415 [archaeon]
MSAERRRACVCCVRYFKTRGGTTSPAPDFRALPLRLAIPRHCVEPALRATLKASQMAGARAAVNPLDAFKPVRAPRHDAASRGCARLALPASHCARTTH